MGKGYKYSIARERPSGYNRMKKIWEFINEILTNLWGCFRTEASFQWFVVAVLGTLMRTDTLGVSSIIRSMLHIIPKSYESLLQFFRSQAWAPKDVSIKWLKTVNATGLVENEQDRVILVGGGVKCGKEATRMPCVKNMKQESGDTSKPDLIQGHLFGGLGIIIANKSKRLCVPLSMTIQDGVRPILEWIKSEYAEDSHVTRPVREGCKAAKEIGKEAFLLMDRAFLSVPALKAMADEAEKAKAKKPLVCLIAAVKGNAVAYEDPVKKAGRGRPRKKGQQIKLNELFDKKAAEFKEAVINMYGKDETVKYLCANYSWGDGLYQKIRFVLVVTCGVDTRRFILACTDTAVPPLLIIKLYCRRFKIESCFRAFKQLLNGFGYHFWTHSMPPYNKGTTAKTAMERLGAVIDKAQRENIIRTYKAIESFVMINCVALGLLQLCAIKFSENFCGGPLRWLRTCNAGDVSEETVALRLAQSFPLIFCRLPHLAITQIIKQKQPEYIDDFDDVS